MNSTIEKFGYPQTLLREFDHWLVLLRPTQVTLGSLVIAAKSDATAFGQLAPPAFAELGAVIASAEGALGALTSYDKINYLMLMMVDPHVHFHVFPRYSEPRSWLGQAFPDQGWPGVPDLKSGIALDPEQLEALKTELERSFSEV